MSSRKIGSVPNQLLAFLFLAAVFTIACSAQTEQQALASLRQMTREGKLPPETVVAGIESKFSSTKTGALARLLRARIKFENKDFAGAASILNSNIFREKTNVGDYAEWLRARSLQSVGNHAEAMAVAEKLLGDFPNSLHRTEISLLWADSAIRSGQAAKVPAFLETLNTRNEPGALLATAKAYESQSDQTNAVKFYRRVYFYGAGTDAAKEAETKLTSLAQPLAPQTADEIETRAETLFNSKQWAAAHEAYLQLYNGFPASITPQTRLRRVIVTSNLKRMPEARSALDSLPVSAAEREEAYYHLALGYARSRLWPDARRTIDEMRQKYPKSDWTPKAMIDTGYAARDAKNRPEEAYFLRTAVTAYPTAIDVAQAQFELAWMQHEDGNFALSSQMLTEHLARYVDKDTTNRGKAGYWAARDSERAGKNAEACALYDAVLYRYSANWYGYLAEQRLDAMKKAGKCGPLPAGSIVERAAANLKTVTVAPETATEKELLRTRKSEDLSTVGLFDWAIDELQEARKTAPESPKVNLELAQYYRLKGDNVNALLSLAKSYPDYSQMFPEEMGKQEWDIFYPLTNWNDIKFWAKQRSLDQYQVAGLIRQESVFNPRARSHANAYGLMQLLIPTARTVARKFGSATTSITGETLFQPAVNIELGTGYLREQFDKFGRIEYVAAAYNAGPGRIPGWRASLPYEMDEFVEAIPFRETRGYVQGVIRNSAQYRRLYDDNGNFKPNVGSRPLRAEINSKPREQLAAEFPDLVVNTGE